MIYLFFFLLDFIISHCYFFFFQRDLCSKKPHLRYVGVEDSVKSIRRAYTKSEAYQIRVTRIKKEIVLLCPICEKPGHNSVQCRIGEKN